MDRDLLIYGFVGALIGGLLTWIICSEGLVTLPNKPQTNIQTNATLVDQHFIEQMIPHHEDAITMAKIAQEKAQTPEVKQLALAIIDDQSHEIEQMKVWYKQWFGRELSTGNEVMQHHGTMSGGGLHMGMMEDGTDITRLASATDFDRAFVEEMIPHHQMAVMMASMLKDGTTRPEMKQLADNIMTAQTSEIEQMRGWLQKWNQ